MRVYTAVDPDPAAWGGWLGCVPRNAEAVHGLEIDVTGPSSRSNTHEVHAVPVDNFPAGFPEGLRFRVGRWKAVPGTARISADTGGARSIRQHRPCAHPPESAAGHGPGRPTASSTPLPTPP
ncbi:hypothetical protein [Pseudonocardia adelaidensis]|uniref:hypothetical protein n=1 Tax=Pseudonocardia adelaidensis TaxID=648754 RepID=UPI0031E8433C